MNAKPALVRPRHASELDRLVALWISRIAVTYTSARGQLNEGLYADDIRQLLGLRPLEGTLSKVALRPLLKTRAAELNTRDAESRTTLYENIRMLSDLLDLDDLQCRVIAFSAASQQQPLLIEIMEAVRTPTIEALARLLSVALNVSPHHIRKAIRPEGQLLATGVVTVTRSDLGRGLQFELPANLRHALFLRARDAHELVSTFLEDAPPAGLRESSFAHLESETDLLTKYLANAHKKRVLGVNVLIYGPPGTGKTEYVRWLAERLNRKLYQVRSTGESGGAISGTERLSYFRLAQRFLRHGNAFILFDEIEDVFPSDDAFTRLFSLNSTGPGKLFMNQLLETNPVPAFWVSNEVEQIDKAYLRRFDFSFEMGIPPQAVRKEIVKQHFKKLTIRDETIRYLAQQEELSPAQVEKAAKVLSISRIKTSQRDDTIRLIIGNSCSVLGQSTNDGERKLDECSYQLDFLNPDCDVKRLVDELKKAEEPTGALCFYGPPGTGKTALAHYLAREIESPLVVKRASDVLGSYVGETEKKIAAMFEQATDERAMLLLDEADSFLMDRQGATRPWELSTVNEMLTQMERFEGLFVCSTNLMDRLDTASLRRFALKIRFDYLRADQRWALFVAQAKRLNTRNESAYRSTLDQMTNLTPGDFATVRRQAALFNVALTAEELLQRLQHESRSKANRSRPIGFIHSQ